MVKEVLVKLPMRGEIIPLSEVDDFIFSGKVIGEGVAIKPEDGIVYSPVNGTIEVFYETKHAIVIRTEEGIRILMHIGIGTVSLDGRGFGSYVNEGDEVKAGDKLVFFDKEYVEKRATLVSPIIILDKEKIESFEVDYKASKIGEDLIKINLL